jgi:hypothetical protein
MELITGIGAAFTTPAHMGIKIRRIKIEINVVLILFMAVLQIVVKSWGCQGITLQ